MKLICRWNGWLFSLCLCLCLWLIGWACPALAQSESNLQLPDQFDQNLRLYDTIPDWDTFTFEDFGSVLEGGSVPDPERSWNAGDAVSDILQLGDVSESLAIEDFSLDQISQIAELDLSQVALDAFPLLEEQTISQLVEVVPFLGDYQLQEVASIQALFEQQGIDESLFDNTLSDILDSYGGELGNLTLSQFEGDLGQFAISDLPNVETIALSNYEDWWEQSISQIPGLSSVPLGMMPNPLSSVGGVVARVDFIWSPAENDRTDTVSGGYEVGFSVPCSEGGLMMNPPDSPVQPALCAHLELDDVESVGRAIQLDFEGKQWISGKYQAVEGGFGNYKYLPSAMGYPPGYEPTGRHPFGQMFKHVIWEPDETTDTASSLFFFRLCDYFNGCTPYNQFAVPFVSYPINSYIFVGLLNEFGGSPINGGSSGGGGGGFGGGGSYPGAPTRPGSGSAVPCSGQTVGTVNVNALGESLAAIESFGGDYSAVGVYGCDQDGLCGRGLGKYQTMNYKESVQAVVGARPGGAEWLAAIERGHEPTEAEIMQYYPPEAQEQVYQQEVAALAEMAQQEIDPTTGQPFTGRRLVERVSQMWLGGPYVAIDNDYGSDGNLTPYDYGVIAGDYYESIAGSATTCSPGGSGGGSGQATGELANPLPGGTLTSGFGWRTHPVTGETRFHSGIDLAAGGTVVSADGGQVDYIGYDGNGYGNYVIVYHGEGRATLYGHLDSVNVQQGQALSPNDVIGQEGNTGLSTGVHLHFEVIEGYTPGQPLSGQAQDPLNYLNL